MEELVVLVKNNNKIRETYNENRSNFYENHSTVMCFACRRPEHIFWKCPERNQDLGRVFKLRNAPQEGESVFILKNPSNEPIIEVYAAKRRKGNDGEATEVKTPELSKEEKNRPKCKEKKTEEESTSDEEAGSESEEEEYENESLINEAYFYIKLRKANDKPKICEICSKEETGQLERTAIIQHEIIIEGGLPIKQRFYSTSKPEHEFISAEICRIEEAGI
ncbi:12931_t:CDS:2, partial [Gigaspora margarita]